MENEYSSIGGMRQVIRFALVAPIPLLFFGSSVFGLQFAAAFSSTQKRLPFPGSDSTPTRPPIRSAAFFTMANPIPVPGYSFGLSRRNMLNNLPISSAEIPIPLSSIHKRTNSPRRSVRNLTAGLCSGATNLKALVSRFSRTRCNEDRLARTLASCSSSSLQFEHQIRAGLFERFFQVQRIQGQFRARHADVRQQVLNNFTLTLRCSQYPPGKA